MIIIFHFFLPINKKRCKSISWTYTFSATHYQLLYCNPANFSRRFRPKLQYFTPAFTNMLLHINNFNYLFARHKPELRICRTPALFLISQFFQPAIGRRHIRLAKYRRAGYQQISSGISNSLNIGSIHPAVYLDQKIQAFFLP